ncbi:hypothetical protein [Micromonospora humidisoli]|uniref:hypothetical protein n=1 Tax=Micromonospora sp. AKA109 TaxID=2733865 RepID=UPI00249077C3|nr:hypothetical protein [Micromonospora sp. AKA109]
MSETVSWFGSARRSAAHEFGRRMWRWFAAFEIVRRVAPTVLLLVAAGMAVWLAVRWSAWWLPRLALIAALSAGLGVAVWVWRRWRWSVQMGIHRPVLGVAGLVLAAVAGGAVYWLR